MALAIMLDLFVVQKFDNPMELADRLESSGACKPRHYQQLCLDGAAVGACSSY